MKEFILDIIKNTVQQLQNSNVEPCSIGLIEIIKIVDLDKKEIVKIIKELIKEGKIKYYEGINDIHFY